jgi:Zinc knuckle
VTIKRQVGSYFGKGQETIQKMQIREGCYTYQLFLEQAIETYQTLIDTGEWTMNVPTKDKMSPETNALVQKVCNQVVKDLKGSNSSSSGKNKNLSKVKCFKCNEMGHYANKCPKTEKTTTAGTAPTMERWKHKPPRSGDANSKTENVT